MAKFGVMVPLLEAMSGHFKDEIKQANKSEKEAQARVDRAQADYDETKKAGKTFLLADK